jgi:hypothetical protein
LCIQAKNLSDGIGFRRVKALEPAVLKQEVCHEFQLERKSFAHFNNESGVDVMQL